MFYMPTNKQNVGRIIPRMGTYSLNKLCKCHFHRSQNAMHSRRRLKRRNSSIKAGDVLAFALREQAKYLGLDTFGGFGHRSPFMYLFLLYCYNLFIPSVLTRNDFFPDDDRMDVDPPVKPRRAAPEPQLDDEDHELKPASRRNRLAALAQTINTWEDDLSRPVIK